ncbi:MAG: hypothetical protein J6Y03_00245 [Alphaproteobacteria bacterium]|nr:hypothetical protein [Alphaproteobacteria bacterium]
MAKNTTLSSSEQYVKRSNRRLLFIGIAALLVFLFIFMGVMSGTRREQQVDTPAIKIEEPLLNGSQNGELMNFPKDTNTSLLTAYPTDVALNNVALGGVAEGVVTLTVGNKPVRIETMDLAEVQSDGFIVEEGTCRDVLQPNTTCNLKIMWNPVSIRTYSNFLNIRWRVEDTTAYPPSPINTLIVNISGQSTDSKDCVICETKEADRAAQRMGELDEKTGLYIKDGEIMGIVELDKIAISLDGTLLGHVTKDTAEVVGENGEVLGRVLGDDTVVAKDLTVLGGALPLASVLDSSGRVIGRLVSDGTVVDTDDKLLGLPMADGSVVGLTDGRIIGSIMPWSVILNLSSKAIGATQLNGTVVSAEGQVIGRILPGGLVVNDSGAIVGGTVAKGLGIGHTCGILGKVGGNGKIYNAFDQQVAYTTINGLVLDMSGVPVGMVIREGLIINPAGEVIAFLNSEGKAVTKDADLIGCVNPDGSVASGKEIIGAIMPRGRVIGYDGEVQGLVLPSGFVVKPTGEAVGSVLTSGYVMDLNEKIIGAVIPKGTAVAPGCVLLGILDLNGQVINSEGVSVGFVDPDKKVLNRSGEVIGGVTPLGAVVDLKGKFLGYVRPDGKVVDKTGSVIGCVNPDGTVVDEKGNLIGIVADATAGAILDENGNPTGWTVVNGKEYDENGNLIGTLIDDKVVNERGEIIGFIPPDGIIVSPEGRFLGRFTSKIGFAMDPKGVKFARVLPDYTAVSIEKSEIIGALIPDGSQIINIDNERIGSVNGNGEVIDSNSQILGNIRADGSVMDKDGVVLGGLMPTGSVLDWNGKVLGSVQGNGTVMSADQKQIGVVTLNRTVLNSDGAVIGMVFPEASIPLGKNGELIGFMTINGEVNKDGKPVGHVTAAGNVYGNNGQVLGSLVRLGSVIGTDGRVKGWLAFEGKVNAREDFHSIGKMMPDGYAVDESGMQVGHLIPRQTVTDLKGNFAGVVSVDGRVLGRTGEVLGSFPYDDRLINAKDIWVGRVLQKGVALDVNGKKLGFTRYDAAVVNERGQAIGQIRYDNRIIDANNQVLGSYIPYGTLYFDQKGKVLGAMAFDGVVRDGKGAVVGQVIGTTLVNNNDEILGNMMPQGFAENEQGKVMGHIFSDATVLQEVDGVEETDVLTTSMRIVDKNKAIVGGYVPFGICLASDLSIAGNAIADGTVLQSNTLAAKTLPDSVMYDSLDKVVGGLIEPSVMVGRDGRIVGTTSISNAVNDNEGSRIATLMPFGTALSVDNRLVGITMPIGAAVDDFAKIVGFVAPDGSVVKADGALVGRAMQDGTIVRLLSRDSYGVMPDFADVISSGAAIGLKPVLFGRSMPSGDVLDIANKKIASVLDDATLLGTDGNLAGALVGFRTAIDHQTNVIGDSTGDGYVTDIKGAKVGPLASNGAVKGKHQLKTLGAVVPKELVTKQCQIQGQVRYDGRIIDGNAKVVGYVGLDGLAKDEKGQSLGGIVLKGTVIADNGDVLGRTLPDADVVNMEGVSIGCALEDGTVIDHDGNVIGHVLKRGIVVDENGNVIGRVLRNGQVVNANGEVIGKVLGDGTVVDLDGNKIGSVVDIKKNHLLFDDNGNIIGSMDKGGKVFDNNGKHLFTVGADDKLYDPNGNLIGYLDEDGNIYDLAGNKIGNATNLPNYIYDANGNITGYIKDGKLFDLDGNQTGWIGPDGIIYDMNGKPIGRLNPDGTITMFEDFEKPCQKYDGIIYDENGEMNGWIKDCVLYDKYGNVIGYVDEYGNIRDKDGNIIGKIHPDGTVEVNGKILGKLDTNPPCKKYDGTVYDDNGELLYTIKNCIVYDKYGNVIGYVDEFGNIRDANGNIIGKIHPDGTVEINGKVVGKLKPTSSTGFVSGVKNLLAGSPGIGGAGLTGRRIAIGDKSFFVMPDNTIVDATGAVVGTLRNGVPYSLSGNLLADELGLNGATGANGLYPQEKLQFDPAQASAMRDLLARRRAEMKQGVGRNMAKITPDGRVLARAKQKQDKDFGSKIVSSWPVDMTRMILKDKAIPAVLVRSIDSRYPSVPASAIVERNVFAEDGRNIVIPAGSKLIGRCSGGAGTNHVSMMEISWERLIRPDGSQFTLSGTSGDAQGRGGVAAYLDEQWLARYGKPLLQSTLTSAISYIISSDDAVTTNENYGTSTQSARAQAAQDARERFLDDMEQIFQQMIEESSSTPPVVFVPSGTRMTVFAMDDLWLRSEQDDEDDYVAENGPDPTAAQTPKGNSGRMQQRPTADRSTRPAATNGSQGSDEAESEDDEDYYEPEYTDENIYTPASSDEDEETASKKEQSLEDRYRSRQGLSDYKVNQSVAKPLAKRGSSRVNASDTLY